MDFEEIQVTIMCLVWWKLISKKYFSHLQAFGATTNVGKPKIVFMYKSTCGKNWLSFIFHKLFSTSLKYHQPNLHPLTPHGLPPNHHPHCPLHLGLKWEITDLGNCSPPTKLASTLCPRCQLPRRKRRGRRQMVRKWRKKNI